MENVEDLLRVYESKRGDIERRIEDFERIRESGTELDLFKELVFCLLTPQSKARVCWSAVESLTESGVIFSGDEKGILKHLKGVRFKENKARYIVLARDMFARNGKIRLREILESFENPSDAREWFVKNVKGMGYKEASHFLRNTGFGLNLAILDRHILKNLKLYNVIPEIPKSLTRKRYLSIENSMRRFAEDIGIPMPHLDLLLWCKETGEVFK